MRWRSSDSLQRYKPISLAACAAASMGHHRSSSTARSTQAPIHIRNSPQRSTRIYRRFQRGRAASDFDRQSPLRSEPPWSPKPTKSWNRGSSARSPASSGLLRSWRRWSMRSNSTGSTGRTLTSWRTSRPFVSVLERCSFPWRNSPMSRARRGAHGERGPGRPRHAASRKRSGKADRDHDHGGRPRSLGARTVGRKRTAGGADHARWRRRGGSRPRDCSRQAPERSAPRRYRRRRSLGTRITLGVPVLPRGEAHVMRHMRFNRYSALALAGVLLALAPAAASAQEVALVAPDAKEVAKGYRADELKLRSVVNDKGDIIGHIDDFIFGRDDGPVFVVLSVGDFVGLGGELVAVPFKSLKLDDSSGKIVLPGASLAALRKLPVFLYNR